MSFETTLLNYSGVTGARILTNTLRDAHGAYGAHATAAREEADEAQSVCNDAYDGAQDVLNDARKAAVDDAAREAAKADYEASCKSARENLRAAEVAASAAQASVDKIFAELNVASNNAKFFKPLKSTSDAFFSVTSIISAPVFLSVLSAKKVLKFIVSGLESLVNLAMLDTVSARNSIKLSNDSLLASFRLLLAAAVSPFVNSVDFFGSAVTSFMSESPVDGETSGPRI